MQENSIIGEDLTQNAKLVSIIVPIYNASEYLKKCIMSILNQTYNNIEVMLVDDGSTDNSLDICKEFSVLDKRIVIHSQANLGVSCARNIGIEKAKGSFIMFVDSDDFIQETMITEMVAEFDDNIGIVFCGYNLYDFNGECLSSNLLTLEKKSISELDEFIPILEKNWSPWGKLYRREIIGGIRFDANISIAEDLKFNVDIIKKRSLLCLKVLNSALYNYRINRNSIMRSPYSGKLLDALLIEEMVYKEFIALGCSEDSMCKVLFGGVLTFYDRFSLLNAKNREKEKSAFRLSRKIISDNKYYLLKKKNRSKKDVIIMRLIIFFPNIYFGLKPFYKKFLKLC